MTRRPADERPLPAPWVGFHLPALPARQGASAPFAPDVAMLFSSYEFLLAFLPVTLGLYWILCRQGFFRTALGWLVGSSLCFYGWWNPVYLWLILASIGFNYLVGCGLSGRFRSKALLGFGLVVNLALLGYYKYTHFLLTNLNAAAGTQFHVDTIVLPLGISFFTFTQIAYLVDAWRGSAGEYSFWRYTLFVTFFPHLIAGPIVHHRDLIPQFSTGDAQRVNPINLMSGTALLVIGLCKKVLLADKVAVYASPLFTAVERGYQPPLLDAWGGSLAYTMQLYFDFSGYGDMALGISLLFGVRMPLNFNSPYKATSIIDFWRRWHMSLSQFLRDYLYIPLGGSKKGPRRRLGNLMATMLLGGLWHGAGWTFVIWGGLHGVYLVINHAWRAVRSHFGADTRSHWLGRFGARMLTFLCVVVGWVFFRAESTAGAVAVLGGMAGVHGTALPIHYAQRLGPFTEPLQQFGVHFKDTLFQGIQQVVPTLICLVIAWFLPNSQTLLRKYCVTTNEVKETSRVVFRPTLGWCLLLVIMAYASILNLGGVQEFLYFQF